MNENNIYTEVVQRNYCIGCGVCVSVCPTNHIIMKDSKEGLLKPVTTEKKCSVSCSICLNVCPFSPNTESQDDISNALFSTKININQRKECGYYLGAYIGYSSNKEIRWNSASGGLTTHLLCDLFDKKFIDAVACVKPYKEKPFFRYVLCESKQEILECSRSAYYTVDITKVLTDIIYSDKESVAIVALPCMAKAIRSACSKNAKLKSKISYVISLVCGQVKNQFFSDYLALKNGVDLLEGLEYRKKKCGTPTANFIVSFKYASGEKDINFSDYAKEWSFRYFTPNACNFCDDIFAESADVAFMDAWDGEYMSDDKGFNFVLVRNENLEQILSVYTTVKPVPIEKVIKSQRGVIYSKREAISSRIDYIGRDNVRHLRRDYLYSKVPFVIKKIEQTKYLISLKSTYLWNKKKSNLKNFERKMRALRFKLLLFRVLNKLSQIINMKK